MQLVTLLTRLESMADLMLRDAVARGDGPSIDMSADLKAMIDDYRRFLGVTRALLELFIAVTVPEEPDTLQLRVRKAAVLDIFLQEYANDLAHFQILYTSDGVPEGEVLH